MLQFLNHPESRAIKVLREFHVTCSFALEAVLD